MMQKMRKMVKNDKGFTLIELLIVVIILAILAAIAIPRFTKNKEEAINARAKADAKILQNAVELYTFDTKNEVKNYTGDFGFLVPNYLKDKPEEDVADYSTDGNGKVRYTLK